MITGIVALHRRAASFADSGGAAMGVLTPHFSILLLDVLSEVVAN
jgi:hypothetical protein